MVANQVWFTTTTKHIIGGVGGAVAGNGVGSIGGNSVDFSEGNSMSSIGEDGMGFVGVGFGGNNGASSSMNIGADGNLGEAVVCLGALSATATGPTSFRFNVAVPTSLTAGRGYPTFISSIVQVGQAIKPPVLLFWVQPASWAVSVFAVVRPFEDTQEVMLYKKFFAVMSPDK